MVGDEEMCMVMDATIGGFAIPARYRRVAGIRQGVSMNDAWEQSRWGLADKRALLALWADGARDGVPERFLAEIGAPRALLQRWRAEEDAGELADDAGAAAADDASVASLARSFRSLILQRAPRLTVPPNSLAGPVVFNWRGERRRDYLARARSALRAVLDAAAADPTRVLNVRAVEPEIALAALRRRWGVDTIPQEAEEAYDVLHPNLKPDVEPASVEDRRSATARRFERWEGELAVHPITRAALREWLASSPLTVVEADPAEEGESLGWASDPMLWPPIAEREHLLRRTRQIVGRLDGLDDVRGAPSPSERHLAVLRRRIDAIARQYVSGGTQRETRNRLFASLRADVVRPWQGETKINFAAEDPESVQADAATLRSLGVITSMAAYEALAHWTRSDTDVIIQSLRRSSADPAAAYRSALLVPRPAARLVEAAEKRPKDHWDDARFVSTSSPAVLRLFQRAEELRGGAGQELADFYLRSREAISTPLRQMTLHDKQVVLFADLIANLAVANHRTQRLLRRDQTSAFKEFLKVSAAEADRRVYGLFGGRDTALSLQGRSHEAAVGVGRQVLSQLRRGREQVTGNDADERRRTEVEQQLTLLIAGSAVQLLEEHLGQSRRAQEATPIEEWQEMVGLAMRHADHSLALIEEMDLSGDLSSPRFESGFFADESFLFRAHEIYYRCACAAATATWAFNLESLDYIELLPKIHKATVSLKRPFTDDNMGRLLPSMIWHAFLMGHRMPALQYDANPRLFDFDPLVRVLGAREEGDPAAITVWTWNRLDVLTSQLIDAGKHAGPLGTVPKDSRVWQFLDDRSNGQFSQWRTVFGDRLLPSVDGGAQPVRRA